MYGSIARDIVVFGLNLAFIIGSQVTAGGEDDIGMVEKRGGSGGHGPLLR